MAARLNFLADAGLGWMRGDTIPAMPMTFKNDDGSAVDLTGASITWDIYDNIKGRLLARLRTANAEAAPDGQPEGVITITSATGGTARVEQIPPAVTNAMAPSKAGKAVRRWYSVEIQWAGDPPVCHTPFDGYIDVEADGT